MNVEFDIAEPRAQAMIQSLRAFGYDLNTAIADLIDNSISAKAKNIWLEFYWNGENSHIAIVDDGQGMTEEELVNAMRPGSRSPLEQRDARDLGRFGLGLKTASFSQCRRLTVATRVEADAPVSVRCWDLDYVTKTGEWRLLRTGSPVLNTYIERICKAASGTVVLWEMMDRLVQGNDVKSKTEHKLFLERVEQVEKHVAMVYHRFLSRSRPIRMWINGQSVAAWDPYLEGEKARQVLAPEALRIFGKKMTVTPYVLPHHSKIDRATHARAAGPKGWNAQQGFYVYRNDRLLVDGDWLGLGPQKEEHYKLARIALDIPNTMDSEWEIDVKKSRARPPAAIREDLRRIATIARNRAAEVYRHRGKVLSRTVKGGPVFAWERGERDGAVIYRVNRNHPLVRLVLDSAENRAGLNSLLRVLEETVPVPLIVIDHAEQPERHAAAFEGCTRELRELILPVYEALLKTFGSAREAKARLIALEPFDRFPEVIASIDE